MTTVGQVIKDLCAQPVPPRTVLLTSAGTAIQVANDGDGVWITGIQGRRTLAVATAVLGPLTVIHIPTTPAAKRSRTTKTGT